MALTRKMLKAMGIEDDKADQIIEAHTETINGLTAFKTEAAKLAEEKAQLEKELEAAKNDGFKGKYDILKGEFDAFKADVAAKETRGAKENAYKSALRAAGLPDKLLDRVTAVSSGAIDALELDENGAAKNADALAAAIKNEWADFIPATSTKGAPIETPPQPQPAPDFDNMTDAEYYAAKFAAKKG